MLNIAKWLLVVIALYFLTKQGLLNWHVLFNFQHHLLLLFAAVVLMFITVFLSSYRWWQLLTAQKFFLKLKQIFKPTYIGLAYNYLIPGGVGGDFIRLIYMLAIVPNKRAALALSIFADRFIGLLGIFVTIAITSLIKLNSIQHSAELTVFFYFAFAIVALTLIGVAVSIMLPQRLGLSALIEKRFGHNQIAKMLLSLLDALYIYRQNEKVFFKAVAVSVLIQFMIAFTVYLIGLSFGFTGISIIDYCFATMITQIANLIPLTPGGIGVGEMAFAQVLSLFESGAVHPYANIFLGYRLLNMLISVPGIFLYLIRKRIHEDNNAVTPNV